MTTKVRSIIGDYRKEVTREEARAAISSSFPDFKVITCGAFEHGGGMSNNLFLVNSDYLFRFPRNEVTNESMKKEVRLLPHLKEHIDVSVPNFEFVAKMPTTGFTFVGYRMIAGKEVRKAPAAWAKELANFFAQIWSFDPKHAMGLGVPATGYKEKYQNQLLDARDCLCPVLKEHKPRLAGEVIEFLEEKFAWYLAGECSDYEPRLLHGDLEFMHALWDRQTGQLKGIIDWGGSHLGDPDYDLWRPYFWWGEKFIRETGKALRIELSDRFFQKLNFFWGAQLAYRAVRAIVVGDAEDIEWNIERLVSHVHKNRKARCR